VEVKRGQKKRGWVIKSKREKKGELKIRNPFNWEE